MTLEERLQAVRHRIAAACRRVGRAPDEVTTVAITKTVAPADIIEAYQAGLRHFGENRVQEAEEKLPSLLQTMPDATWHMVGHLQTNKARKAADLFAIIHSVDSIRLAQALDRCATGKLIVFIEVNVSGEESKEGVSPDAVADLAAGVRALPNLDLAGLMTVAPQLEDPEAVRPVFRRLKEMRDSLGLLHLSMGMTEDFEVAIEEGATMIRLGRAIFGPRRE